ncbi:MAG: hypothetical protein ACYDD0_06410, partial [Candidatus Dormibacteria bacterium]
MSDPLVIWPDEETVAGMRGAWPLVPMWAELPIGAASPLDAFAALAGDGHGVLLESLDISGNPGPYTIVAGDPAAVLAVDSSGSRILQQQRSLPLAAGWSEPPGDAPGSLKRLAYELRAPAVPDLPTLAGGLVGMLAYEAAALLGHHAYPRGRGRPPGAPILLLLIDRVAVFDHLLNRLCLVAHVQPEGGYQAGAAALQSMADQIAQARPAPPEASAAFERTLTVAPNLSGEMFKASVRRAREHIAAGDIYQAVLSRRLSASAQ